MTKNYMTFEFGLLVLAALLVSVCTKPTIEDLDVLFRNTVKKYNVVIKDKADYHERYRRLVDFKDRVDASTTDVTGIHTLNRFAVNNDEEHEILMERAKSIANWTVTEMGMRDSVDRPVIQTRQESSYFDHDDEKLTTSYLNPAPLVDGDSFDHWENNIGLSRVQDQAGCGSCWSFPTAVVMEAKYKQRTGEHVVFSKQYFLECTFDYSGCAGGKINDGFNLIKERNFIPSEEDHPYTADYIPCNNEKVYAMRNAMEKMWLTDWYPLSKNEESFLKEIRMSPIAFGAYISKNYFGYTGSGLFDDALCATEATPHAQAVVGYTPTYFRVRGSYGTIFGDYGYINYKRSSGNLLSCRFFDTGFTITMELKQDIEYEYCSNAKLVTRGECNKSCASMNKEGDGGGWTLASIPTAVHNEQIVNMINSRWPGVKTDDKFKFFWMGLEDLEKNENLQWQDPVFRTNYVNISNANDKFNWGRKYGIINRNTGNWNMKSSHTVKFRGLCSRAITCKDISTINQRGTYKFSDSTRGRGTVAELVCNEGCIVIGASTKLTCRDGRWDSDGMGIPDCTCSGDDVIQGRTWN